MREDKLHIIVSYDPENKIDLKELESFGAIVDDLGYAVFIRLASKDEDGSILNAISSIPNVKYAHYNTIINKPRHAVTITDNQVFRLDRLYTEMNLYNAWEITKGDSRIKIGIVDSGVDLAHPDINCGVGGIVNCAMYSTNGHYPFRVDLQALLSSLSFDSSGSVFRKYDPNWFEIVKNQGIFALPPAVFYTDSTCTTQCDENGAQYLWIKEPFVLWYMEESGVSYCESVFGMPHMHDGYGHGTAIAGLISSPHNGNGFAGIAPDCTTLMYKFVDDSYYGTLMSSCAAVKKAADDGCHVISMSWGGPGVNQNPVLHDTLIYAYNKGCVLVGATGNASQKGYIDSDADALDWPAAYDEVIGVGGCGWYPSTRTTLDNDPPSIDFNVLTPFAQKFPQADVVAPCWGWIFHAPTQHAMMWYQYPFNTEAKYYSFMSDGGTSFSCPSVAAILALCMSKKLQLSGWVGQTVPLNQRPWTHADVSSWLSGGAKGSAYIPGTTTMATKGIGVGRIDAYKALGAVT